MLGLIAKDARTVGPFLLALLPFYLVTALGASRLGPALFGLSLALALALILLPPGVDWRTDTESLIASLPVSRSTVVVARYVWALLAIAVSLTLWLSLAFVLPAALDQADPDLRRWISLNGALAFSSLAILLTAIFLPCYFRWGIGRGMAVFSIGLMALSAALSGGRWLVRAAIGGDVPDLTGADLEAARALARLAWIVMVVLVTVASAAVSIRFHRQREF